MVNKFLFSIVLFSLIACSSEPNKTEKKNEMTIENEMVENPSTADNPTATRDKMPVMTFESLEHNFGDIYEGQIVQHSYKFKNTGNADLLITECKAQCGCTTPYYPKKPIPPGGEDVIKIEFDSHSKSGQNRKNISIFTNCKENPIELIFHANVYAKK